MPRPRKPIVGKIADPNISLAEKIHRALDRGAVPSFKKLLPQAVDLYRAGYDEDVWIERFFKMIIQSHGPLSRTGFEMACVLEEEAQKRGFAVPGDLANKLLPLALDAGALSVLPFLHQHGANIAALEAHDQRTAKITLSVFTGDGHHAHTELLCPDLFLDPGMAQIAARQFFSDAAQKSRSHRGWKSYHIDHMRSLAWHEDAPRFFGEALGNGLSNFDGWFYLNKHEFDMKQALLGMMRHELIDIESAKRCLREKNSLKNLALLAGIETDYIACRTDILSDQVNTRPRARL